MNWLQLAPSRIGQERSRAAEQLLLDPDAPAVRDLIRDAVLKGRVRAIPAGRGKVAILPLGNLRERCVRSV